MVGDVVLVAAIGLRYDRGGCAGAIRQIFRWVQHHPHPFVTALAPARLAAVIYRKLTLVGAEKIIA